jgi:hypothetical protein
MPLIFVFINTVHLVGVINNVLWFENERYGQLQHTSEAILCIVESASRYMRLTLSDPISGLVRHYDFPVPDAFLDL